MRRWGEVRRGRRRGEVKEEEAEVGGWGGGGDTQLLASVSIRLLVSFSLQASTSAAVLRAAFCL